LVVEGGGVGVPTGGVGGIEELAGPDELETKAFPAYFALQALVTSCILLNFS
jgi:hypothetical protein